MFRTLSLAILLFFSFNCIAQSEPKSIGPSVNKLLDDAVKGFIENREQLAKSDSLNDYYFLKDKSIFKCEEFIVVNKQSKLSKYICSFALKNEKDLFIDDSMNTLITWSYNMEALGGKPGYKFVRKPNNEAGFVFSLYDEQGFLLAQVRFDSSVGSLEVFEKMK